MKYFVKRKDFAVVFEAEKKYWKIIAKTNKKIFGNRKYLRYILRIAKICANINSIFVERKRYEKKRKKRQLKIMAPIWRKIGAQSISKHFHFTFTYSHFDSINTIKATELDIHFLQSLWLFSLKFHFVLKKTFFSVLLFWAITFLLSIFVLSTFLSTFFSPFFSWNDFFEHFFEQMLFFEYFLGYFFEWFAEKLLFWELFWVLFGANFVWALFWALFWVLFWVNFWASLAYETLLSMSFWFADQSHIFWLSTSSCLWTSEILLD